MVPIPNLTCFSYPLILDVGLPGMSGPDPQQELIRRDQAMPGVFIGGVLVQAIL